MPSNSKKISLVYFVVLALLLVGLVPLVLTGWFLSERSGQELRSVENRYQIQLVQEKARQIEMFGQKNTDMVRGLANAFALATDNTVFTSYRTDNQLENTLRENPDLLALYVQPANTDPLSLYRPGSIGREEIQSIAANLLSTQNGQKISISHPQVVNSGIDTIMAIAAPIMVDGVSTGSVTAIVSLKNIAKSVVGSNPMAEDDLWQSGLPIVYVVDAEGKAIFHPDPNIARQQRSLSDLRIVDEWQQASGQFQSGLVPFTAVYESVHHDMIGAYSTARIGENTKFGVITMQDESKALASVSEMRTQTWIISLLFALIALLIGSILTRYLTSPILKLSSAAQRIAAGEFTTRVDSRNITEIGTLGESFNTMSDRLEEHIAKLAHAAKENRELFVGTVKALAAAIDGKDKYTRGHSERVARISVAIGKEMSLPDDELEALRISALLHDVGKIAIDDNILKKPAALTKEEFEIMKTHPVKGFKIMSQIPAMKDFLPGMYMHHEMINGKGYPQGLTGDQIPLQAKIVSVADTFDAMTIDRPYSKGMMLDEALSKIQELVGSRYDPLVVEALIRGCQAGEIGRGVVQTMRNSQQRSVNVGVAKDLAPRAKENDLLDIPNLPPKKHERTDTTGNMAS